MAKKTPASTENSEDSAQDLQQSAKQTAVVQADAVPLAEENTLPFAQPRDELINKFRANAVPREADYKQLLDQHYDVAGALGMANSADNNGDKTGNGLVFDSASSKLHVKANATGGLVSEADGIRIQSGKTLQIIANTVDVKINQKNGLKLSAEGEVGVGLYSSNTDSDTNTAAVIVNNPANTNGLWINVGAGKDKKGLKQYKSLSDANAVLGISHDATLKIDGSTGKLGARFSQLSGLTTSTDGLMVNANTNAGVEVSSYGLSAKVDDTTIRINGSGFLYSPIGELSSEKRLVVEHAKLLHCNYYAINNNSLFFIYSESNYSHFLCYGRGSSMGIVNYNQNYVLINSTSYQTLGAKVGFDGAYFGLKIPVRVNDRIEFTNTGESVIEKV